MARRGENIRKRKDGRWEGRYYVREHGTGKNTLHSIYGKSYGEVREKLSALKEQEEARLTELEINGKMRFGVVAEEWLDSVEKGKKHATYMKYRTIYEKHIQESIGMLTFAELSGDVLAELFQCQEQETLSGSLQRSISCVLNQIFAYAVANHDMILPRYSCKRQKTASKPAEVLNQSEQAKLLQCLYDGMDIYKLGIVVCLSTGLRLGEICSLKWEDVDLEAKMLHVNTTVQRIAIDGEKARTILLEGEPKSIFSKREIPLSDELIKLLSLYYGKAEEYVINRGKPMEPRTYQNKFQKYLQTAGVRKKNFHALRHTFATNCISSGADIKSLSEILGHSDVKITLNRYVHPTTETKRQHMNSLSAVYGQFVGQE